MRVDGAERVLHGLRQGPGISRSALRSGRAGAVLGWSPQESTVAAPGSPGPAVWLFGFADAITSD